jgi:hypothetical protein
MNVNSCLACWVHRATPANIRAISVTATRQLQVQQESANDEHANIAKWKSSGKRH